MLIESDKLRQRRDQTYTLERNVLGVPTFVLHAKAAEKLDKLEHSWTTSTGKMEYCYLRTSKAPFPQVEHARYFDALVGLFATRWNPEGNLWFSIAEGLRFAGMHRPTNAGARKSFLEAIKRYRTCQAEWQNSWQGRTKTWTSPFITFTDIWDEETGELKRNPRGSRRTEHLHQIEFSKHVVQSLKDSKTRVFLTDSLKQLKPDSYAVYRYFYGFSDQSVVTRDLESLMRVFPWLGRKSRFLPWLEKRLQESFDKGFIEAFEIKNDRAFVKCKSLREYKDSAPVIALESKAKKNPHRKGGEAKPKRIAAQKVAPQQILEEYYLRKSKGQLDSVLVEMIDSLLERKNATSTQIAVDALKSRFSSAQP